MSHSQSPGACKYWIPIQRIHESRTCAPFHNHSRNSTQIHSFLQNGFLTLKTNAVVCARVTVSSLSTRCGLRSHQHCKSQLLLNVMILNRVFVIYHNAITTVSTVATVAVAKMIRAEWNNGFVRMAKMKLRSQPEIVVFCWFNVPPIATWENDSYLSSAGCLYFGVNYGL